MSFVRSEAILSANPAVATYSRRTGLQLGGGVTEANQGDFFVRLKPFPRPPITKVMDDVRQKITNTVPALQIETSQLMEDLIGDLTGVPEPIDIKLFSQNQQTLLKLAPKVANAIGKINGVVEVKNGIVDAGDSIQIKVDPVRAALMGVTPDQVTKTVDAYLSGTVATKIEHNQELIGIRVWIPNDLRATMKDIKELRMQSPGGVAFPVEQVASLKVVTGNPQIDRYNLQRVVAVTGRISGRDLGSTMTDVKHALEPKGLATILRNLFSWWNLSAPATIVPWVIAGDDCCARADIHALALPVPQLSYRFCLFSNCNT